MQLIVRGDAVQVNDFVQDTGYRGATGRWYKVCEVTRGGNFVNLLGRPSSKNRVYKTIPVSRWKTVYQDEGVSVRRP